MTKLYENDNKIIEKALIIVYETQQKTVTKDDIEEIKNLTLSSKCEVLEVAKVKLREITPATFIGSGKLLELKQKIEEIDANVVIFDGELSPSQTLNIQDILEVKVIDRTTLILDIFALNATSLEGKLQVELAQLNYIYPRLKGKGANLSRLGGGIGTRGPGETKLETDRRHIKTRILNLKNLLEMQSTRRELQTYRRNKNNEFCITLVGYTNSGKSTLMNLITKSNVLAENKLFATLDTTIRKAKINDINTIFTDTVGFIKNIPTEFIEAFKSTLEVCVSSDLNIIVLDASANYKTQLEVTTKTLNSLGSNSKQLIIYNKCDLVDDLSCFNDGICISCKDNVNIDLLYNKISEILNEYYTKTTLYIDYKDMNEFTKLTKYLEDYKLEYKDSFIIANITCKKINLEKFIKFKKKP